MKVLFLDFDGVMDTEYYDHILSEAGKPISDEYGLLFDPECVKNLKYIIDNTGADIVVSSTWKDDMSYKEILDMWKYRGLPGFVLTRCLTLCEALLCHDSFHIVLS